MSLNNMGAVLVHGAWADGSSWSKVIGPLRAVATPLPLTSLDDDVAALDRTLKRIEGPIVLVGHAYAGAVIAATRDEKVRSLVYVAALAPDEGETVADVFYRAEPHPQAPKLAPDNHGVIWLPDNAFAEAFAGPYAYVRHPMYSGALLLLAAMPLALGSRRSVLLVVPFFPVLVWRILDEEIFLRRDLPGYAEYMQRVRYRFVPRVW